MTTAATSSGSTRSTARASWSSNRSCSLSADRARVSSMAKASEAYVRAGEREVRISSPERVIYEATEATPEVTKLAVAEYFASVEDGLMRALRNRPTALERWPSGVLPGIKLATGRPGEKADAFYQKRVPKGAPEYL